jgi:hypothetical protein
MSLIAGKSNDSAVLTLSRHLPRLDPEAALAVGPTVRKMMVRGLKTAVNTAVPSMPPGQQLCVNGSFFGQSETV